MAPELPLEIRDRVPAPHALRVGLRRAELPSRQEVGAFCGGEGASLESGDSWIRVTWGAARDTLLVLLSEGQGPEHLGFDHALIVESSHSKTCFLAAYFIARRCGGVVQIRQRATALAAGAFAERYLEGEDLDDRWSRAVRL
ncbi:MAG TPA: hypothetical protein VFS19_00245 [Planctomycetota bacterium]|nr:hypothetical protein [Planctomycetota bacterium]